MDFGDDPLRRRHSNREKMEPSICPTPCEAGAVHIWVPAFAGMTVKKLLVQV